MIHRRRRPLITSSALALSLGLALTGCAADGSNGAETAAGETTTVETKFGDVRVPADARTVVALGWGDAETALALGVQPVGASDWLAFGGDGVGPWAEGMYDESPEIIETLEPSYEEIAALEPDVILDVKSSGDQDRYDKLSQIAPTVGVPEGGDDYLTTLDQQVSLIAQALGKEEEGAALLSDLDARFASAAEAHPEFADKTVSVSAYTSEGWGAYVEGGSRVSFMERLGFVQSPSVAALTPDGFSARVSQEELDTLDADLLVTFPIYVDSSEITAQREYREIPAVKDGRAILFTEEDAALSSSFSLNSVLSVPYAIEHLVPRIADTLS